MKGVSIFRSISGIKMVNYAFDDIHATGCVWSILTTWGQFPNINDF